jgi:hypothetical protein
MQASQLTTCPTVLLAHLIYVAKCGKPTSPKTIMRVTVLMFIVVPVVPHKAVAEVSKIGNL